MVRQVTLATKLSQKDGVRPQRRHFFSGRFGREFCAGESRTGSPWAFFCCYPDTVAALEGSRPATRMARVIALNALEFRFEGRFFSR
jgi:hypothetical protein